MLGSMADEQLCRVNILYKGDFSVFVTRPISAAILIALAIMIVYPEYKEKKKKAKREERP